MTNVYDVPAEKLLEKVAERLKSEGRLKPPAWAEFVKTGTHREKAPHSRDWWYYRVAAVMRKVYVDGPIWTSRLSSEFGGKRDKGSAPYRAVRGSRSIVRHSIHLLESLGYITVQKNKGRVVTPEGRSMLDNLAHEILKEMSETRAELRKYI